MPEMLRVALIGIGATVLIDLWALALGRLLGVQGLDYRLVGRWIGHFGHGRFTHDTIFDAHPTRNERLLGWLAHYATGIAFAALFAMAVDADWFAHPRPEIAVLFGVATVTVPFFIMQPALGLGIAASRTPDPLTARVKSVITHAAFGLGLYFSASFLARLA